MRRPPIAPRPPRAPGARASRIARGQALHVVAQVVHLGEEVLDLVAAGQQARPSSSRYSLRLARDRLRRCARSSRRSRARGRDLVGDGVAQHPRQLLLPIHARSPARHRSRPGRRRRRPRCAPPPPDAAAPCAAGRHHARQGERGAADQAVRRGRVRPRSSGESDQPSIARAAKISNGVPVTASEMTRPSSWRHSACALRRIAPTLRFRASSRRRRAACHSLNPRWMATTPPVRLKKSQRSNPASRIIARSVSWSGSTGWTRPGTGSSRRLRPPGDRARAAR